MNEWVAVKDGVLLAHSAKLVRLYFAIDRKAQGCDYVALVPRSGTFEEFVRGAREAHGVLHNRT